MIEVDKHVVFIGFLSATLHGAVVGEVCACRARRPAIAEGRASRVTAQFWTAILG